MTTPGLANVLLNVLPKAVDRLINLIPDKEAAAQARREIEQEIVSAAVKAEADQREINKIEAANSNAFVAGWRPAVGWICAVSLAFYFWPKFVLGAIFWSYAAVYNFNLETWNGQLPTYPDMGIADILGLLGTLLGGMAVRSFDKYIGADTKTVGPRAPVIPVEVGSLRPVAAGR